MNMSRATGRRPAKRAFTIIELVVVILIIAILASLLMSAASWLRNRAKKAQSNVVAVSLRNAIRSYHHEYGYWPCPVPSFGGTWSNNNYIVVNYLLASNNPNNMSFWETTGAVVDAYGKYYAVTIDVTNNTVAVTSVNTEVTALLGPS